MQTALRAWPALIRLVFRAFGEASNGIEDLAQWIANKRAANIWRAPAARTEAEARSFVIAQLRRRWGCAAVRERARMLIARVPQVGRPRLPGRAAGVGDAAPAAEFQMRF